MNDLNEDQLLALFNLMEFLDKLGVIKSNHYRDVRVANLLLKLSKSLASWSEQVKATQLVNQQSIARLNRLIEENNNG